jgi:DNA repair exonuclease SbcCD ATPase subunit
MIKLKKLELQGFRLFRDLQTIEFPETGLLLLDGDSGVGKSTILQAIAYALDICPFPSTTLKSWTGETFQVCLTIESDGTEIVINRGKKTSIQVGTGEPKTGAKALEEGLMEVFKLTPELLSALTYRPQDRLGLFLSKDDAEKKEFLGQVLGLNSIEAAIEKADITRKQFATDLTFAQGVLTEKEGALSKVVEGLIEVSPDDIDYGYSERVSSTMEVLKNLEAEHAALDEEFKTAYARFQEEAAVEKKAILERVKQAEGLYDKLVAEETATNSELEVKRNRLRSEINSNNGLINLIRQLEREIPEIRDRIVHLENNRCFTCKQPYVGELALDEERMKLEANLERVASKPVAEKRALELAEALKALVPVVNDQIHRISETIGKLRTQAAYLGKTITDSRVSTISSKKEAKLLEIVKAKEDVYDARDAFNTYTKNLEFKLSLRTKNENAKHGAIEAVQKQKAKVADIEKNLNAEKDFIAAIGKEGFLGAIFDEVLDEISREANEILGSLPNTAHVSTAFKTENQKGKKIIVPVFYVNGFETTRQSGLSGGMGASADLAVDLGLTNVIERRLGRVPGWICLDETFNGMPKLTKEATFEVLQKHASDKLVIVIDHGSELKEMFTKVLTVKNEGGKSVVT